MRETLQGLLPYLRRHQKHFLLGMAALVLKDFLGALLPLFLRAGIDSFSGGNIHFQKLALFGGALLSLTAIKGLFQYWMRVVLIGVSRDIEYEIRQDLFAHLVRLDTGFFQRLRTGDIMARATNDLNAVRMMLGPGIMYWTETSITLVLAACVMFWVDWKLTLVALAPAPIVSFAVIVFGRHIHARFEKIQALFSDISSRVQENLAGVRVLRAYVQEEAELHRFERLNRDFIHQNLRLGVTQGLFMPVLETLIAISFVVVLWVGGRRLLAGELSIGTFLMFNFYLGMLGWPMIALGWVVNLMQRGTASWKRLDAVFKEQPAIAAPATPRPLLSPIEGELRLENVTFDRGNTKALDDVTLRIPGGSTVAIVGHTGSGKSSLVHLLPRLFDPTSGRVTIDGIDLRDLDPEALRQAIGFVPQETFLFSTTLAENIALGAPGASREAIQMAADQAGLAPDIQGFPKGLETEIGERGITLSGGQKQRTAIARAILRNPPVLILDDALSSVDTLTEERILNHLREIMHGRTTILISHRVSTVRQADTIVVLEHGRIAEQGSHEDLIKAGGYYAGLHQRQLLEEELEAI
jgi:ATP-binding cassette subfamily B protein